MNISIGILLAPYRVDYYNYLHDRYNTEIYFLQKGFNGQLFSTESISSNCTFEPRYLQCSSIFSRKIPKRLWYLIRCNNPSFVIVPEFSITTLMVILFRAIGHYKFKIISQCDDNFDMIEGKGFSHFHALSRKICVPLVDNLIVPDIKAVEWYRNRYGKGLWCPIIQDEEKHAYLNDQSILKRARELREEHSMNEQLSILFVGRLIKEKNITSLIKACSQLDNPYTLFIIGDGIERRNLEVVALSQNAKVCFLGPKNGIELYSWYIAADMFILPSILEAFGAVTGEALLCGCYSLVSNRAGSCCLIEPEVNGDLFDPYSIDDIVEKIRHFEKKGKRCNLMTVSFQEIMKVFDELL